MDTLSFDPKVASGNNRLGDLRSFEPSPGHPWLDHQIGHLGPEKGVKDTKRLRYQARQA